MRPLGIVALVAMWLQCRMALSLAARHSDPRGRGFAKERYSVQAGSRKLFAGVECEVSVIQYLTDSVPSHLRMTSTLKCECEICLAPPLLPTRGYEPHLDTPKRLAWHLERSLSFPGQARKLADLST